jgi:hypothetical protein
MLRQKCLVPAGYRKKATVARADTWETGGMRWGRQGLQAMGREMELIVNSVGSY